MNAGEKLGRWTLQCRAKVGNIAKWACRCVCGAIRVVSEQSLRDGTSRSCGCKPKSASHRAKLSKARTTHGFYGTPIYRAWVAMRSRCYDKNNLGYSNYGGRGIRVCKAWNESFENFWKDMSPTWKRGLYLDRKKNSKGYSPANCRWVTVRVSNQNRRTTIKIVTPTGVKTLVEASREYGVPVHALRYRSKQKWPVERLLAA